MPRRDVYPGASRSRGVNRGILLDIEGTTTPIDFVYRVLFPYARDRMASFIEERRGDPAVSGALRELKA